MAPSDSRRSRRPVSASRPLPSPRRVSPVSRITFPACCAHYLRRIEQVHLSIASPFVRPSPLCRRVGIRDFTFEACSGYHSRYGPPSCSTAQGRLCHEASIQPVAQPNRSSATRLSTIWIPPPLVIRAFSGHTAKSGLVHVEFLPCSAAHPMKIAVRSPDQLASTLR